MTLSEPPGEQLPEDYPALLTAALDHSWAWYDGRANHALQAINFYIVATAILVTAYATAINVKHYGLAAALAVAGLGLTAVASGAVLNEINAAALAEPALAEMQERIGQALATDSMRIASRQISFRLRRAGVIAMFGLATATVVAALLYAIIH